jgi:hypothetical protein
MPADNGAVVFLETGFCFVQFGLVVVFRLRSITKRSRNTLTARNDETKSNYYVILTLSFLKKSFTSETYAYLYAKRHSDVFVVSPQIIP